MSFLILALWREPCLTENHRQLQFAQNFVSNFSTVLNATPPNSPNFNF
jgi:hypothetical protein